MSLCVICGADATDTTATFAPFITARTGLPSQTTSVDCPRCGIHYCGHRFTDEQAAAIYADYRSPAYHDQRAVLEPDYGYWRAMPTVRPYDVEPIISRWVTPATVLDIGGHDGANTPFRDTAEVTVVDIGDPEPTGRWNLAVLQHVLEHVADPCALVAMARRHADWLYVEVPVEPRVDVWHEHVNQFSATSLTWTVGHVIATEVLDTKVGLVRWAVAR